MKKKIKSVFPIFGKRYEGKKKKSPPMDDDWENARVFLKFLKTFYDITLKFSATLNVMSAAYFNELCEMQNQLSKFSKQEDSLVSSIAVSMKKKYEKYWGNVDNINSLLVVAVVLDPRFKMDYLKYCFTYVYDSPIYETLPKKVKDTMYRLFEFYSADGSAMVGNENVLEVSVSDMETKKKQ